MLDPLFDNSASSFFLVINPNTSGFFHCQTRTLDAQLFDINWQYSVYVLLGFFVSEHIVELKQYHTENQFPN
jgi:hypothetical protein